MIISTAKVLGISHKKVRIGRSKIDLLHFASFKTKDS